MEERVLHTLMSEMHSLVRAIHASLRGDPEGVRLVLTDTEDGMEHEGEARVMLNSTENRKCMFENLCPSSHPNSVVDMVEERVGRRGL